MCIYIKVYCLFLFIAAAVMYINSMSVTWTTRLQVILTFSKLLAIAIIIFPGLYQLFKGIYICVYMMLTANHYHTGCKNLKCCFKAKVD